MFYYVTSSNNKIRSAKRYLSRYGIEFEKQYLDMIEIQSHSGEDILLRKAQQAFEHFQHPLIVSDHFWHIPALRGFPGAYMKYINQWLKPEDFLNLINPYQDRSIILQEFLCFKDQNSEKIFNKKIVGKFLQERKGKEDSFLSVITLRKDGKSIAECWENDIDSIDGGHPLWETFASWYQNK